jgi:RHS repeat-associated protein
LTTCTHSVGVGKFHCAFLTQKERDNESGLDYFLARYYSSAQGRFTSPDEFVGGPDELFDFSTAASSNPTFYADLTDPQSLNKYQYCYNNPLLYIDPDGHQGFRKWVRDTLRSAAAAFNEDNGLPAPSGDQTTTGRTIGHLAAITQAVTEVVIGGNMIVGGGTEAVVTSPAATTVVGAVIPAGGVAVAVGGAALVVHGGGVLVNTVKNIVNEKSSTGPSAENSPGVSSSGHPTDQHGNKLGPSGEPMVNKTRSTTRETARSKALNEGSRVVEHRNPKRGERHFHPADAAGKKKPSSTHHEY